MRRSGNKVRVNVQLIDANTDEHVWANDYDRDVTDVFAIQSDLAQRNCQCAAGKAVARGEIADDAEANGKRRGLSGFRAGA